MADWKPTLPPNGERITMPGGQLHVPARPIVPFIEGDGTGPDIWRAAARVLDAAVGKAYGEARKIAWMEVLTGQKAVDAMGAGRRHPAGAWVIGDPHRLRSPT